MDFGWILDGCWMDVEWTTNGYLYILVKIIYPWQLDLFYNIVTQCTFLHN